MPALANGCLRPIACPSSCTSTSNPSEPGERSLRYVCRSSTFNQTSPLNAVEPGRYVDASTFALENAPEKPTRMSPTVAAVSRVCTKERFATLAHACRAVPNAACSAAFKGAKEVQGCWLEELP